MRLHHRIHSGIMLRNCALFEQLSKCVRCAEALVGMHGFNG